MQLTPIQIIIMIFAIALGAILTRFLPFFLFPEKKEPPKIVNYLGKVLPSAMMGLLVVYCLKNISLLCAPYAVPEALSILTIIILHWWKSNVLLSIGVGTCVYMILVQTVF